MVKPGPHGQRHRLDGRQQGLGGREHRQGRARACEQQQAGNSEYHGTPATRPIARWNSATTMDFITSRSFSINLGTKRTNTAVGGQLCN